MTKPRADQSAPSPDPVETLLAQAQPRLVPPAEDERVVRDAVHAEWRAVTGRRRSRRRIVQLAAAASVLLAVFATLNVIRNGEVTGIEVAAIGKSHGAIYLLGERSELTEMPAVKSIMAGQTIVTGEDAGIGLAWHGGGSLRIDAGTIVEFRSVDSVFLRDGRVYFDSQSGDDASRLVVDTAHGDVSHVGTQYMAAVDALTLVVSVREGAVTVSRRGGEARAAAGQRLEIVGDARPSVSNISATAAQWAWVEATAPTQDFSGRTTYEFLVWVGRETGYKLAFESSGAERLARDGRLVGAIPGLDPKGELEVRMLGEDLVYTFDQASGTLRIGAANSGT